MMTWLKQIFTWWNGQTMGTRFFTWRAGVEVGRDERGNIYYRSRKNHPTLGERRWVIYKGEAEASVVPPGWYGWLHHLTDDLPTDAPLRDWEQPHKPNMTGTTAAYRPDGSLLKGDGKPATKPDYEAWAPN